MCAEKSLQKQLDEVRIAFKKTFEDFKKMVHWKINQIVVEKKI